MYLYIFVAKQEISSLEEKVAVLQRDLSSYENQLEQLRREGSTKAEAGRASEGALHTQIVRLKEELHSSRFVGGIHFFFFFPRYIFSWSILGWWWKSCLYCFIKNFTLFALYIDKAQEIGKMSLADANKVSCSILQISRILTFAIVQS